MDRSHRSLRLVEEQQIYPEVTPVHVLAEHRGCEREPKQRRQPHRRLVATVADRGRMQRDPKQQKYERRIGLHRDQAWYDALQRVDPQHPPGHGHRADQRRGDTRERRQAAQHVDSCLIRFHGETRRIDARSRHHRRFRDRA